MVVVVVVVHFFRLVNASFFVLGLFFSMQSQENGLGKRLRDNLFCVEWDVKPQLSQSINLHFVMVKVKCAVTLRGVQWAVLIVLH